MLYGKTLGELTVAVSVALAYFTDKLLNNVGGVTRSPTEALTRGTRDRRNDASNELTSLSIKSARPTLLQLQYAQSIL